MQGTTPLGWATIGSKGKPKKENMIKALFSPGDRSVLPRTPGMCCCRAYFMHLGV
jgi:hypothetical protein